MLRQIWGRNLCSFGPRYLHSSALRQARYVRFSNSSPSPNFGQNGKGNNFFESRTWPFKVGAALAGAGVVYYISCLEQVPETGRWRFIAVSPQTESKVGQVALQQTLQQYQGRILPEDHIITRHVKKVVQNVLDASQLGVVKGHTPSQSPIVDFANDEWSSSSSAKSPHSAIASPSKEWNVLVVDDRSIVNAAASPGTVIVFTGILPICRSEQGLAAVLSHEIGHVVARHTAERLSSQSIAIALTVFLAALGLDLGISALVQKMLLELPNSRLQEREADLIGLRLMSKACYDPKASPEMFARLGQLEAKKGFRSPEFFNTHPSSESRVTDLETHLAEGYAILAANPQCAGVQERMESFRENAKMRNVFDIGDYGHRQHERKRDEVWT